MYLCYVDESGTPDLPGNTSHFVVAGVAIPIKRWKEYDQQIAEIKARFRLRDQEMHTAWLTRPYREQETIPNFEGLTDGERRRFVTQARQARLLALQRGQGRDARKKYQLAKKFYAKSDAYIHLTRDERTNFLREVATKVGTWPDAKLFFEAIDKVHFVSLVNPLPVAEQAFEQVITRLEAYLHKTKKQREAGSNPCLVIHDNNPTTSEKHTRMMQRFHNHGTFFRAVNEIVETPLYVDSRLTSMVQVADLCSYAIRRYCENQERDLFDRLFHIADKAPGGRAVGVRHFSPAACVCLICVAHRRAA